MRAKGSAGLVCVGRHYVVHEDDSAAVQSFYFDIWSFIEASWETDVEE